jgi:hypothetical protein
MSILLVVVRKGKITILVKNSTCKCCNAVIITGEEL